MPHTPHILIIDDVPENVDLLSRALSGEVQVRFALSGAKGLEKVARSRPELILLDVLMPDMDGNEVFARLRKDPSTADIPVIFVTARDDPFSESAAINAGAVDFISKPINPTVVRARVRMHLALRARELEVRRLNGELEQRVLERTQALKDALEKAQAAQKAKASLLANMSHEFRTPLNIVLGMCHTVSRQVTDPNVLEKLGKVATAGRSLLALLNDILDMARLDANQFQIECMDFQLDKVLDASLGALQKRAEDKGLMLVREIGADVPANLYGDPVRLGHILGNLVNNAIKFSSQGRITVRVALSDMRGTRYLLRFAVQDEGIGISADDQVRIFAPFEQADGSLTRPYGGVGMGLTLCQFLTQLLGGTMGVESAPGQGSTFWVQIPLEPGTPPATATTGRQDSMSALPVASHLLALLAEDGLAAQAVWQSSRPALQNLLGNASERFANSIEGFDFGAAHHILKTVLAANVGKS